MSEMPADIMEAARDAARRITLEIDDDGRPCMPVDDIEEIAKAILAEREAGALRVRAEISKYAWERDNAKRERDVAEARYNKLLAQMQHNTNTK